MTRQRNDEHSTEFGLWLRRQKEIDSRLCGFTTTNLDYIWENYKTGYWMLLEEKRRMGEITWSQGLTLKKMTQCIIDEKFRGFHLVQFEKLDPDDGKIFLDHKEISRQELIDFLQFK